MLPYWSIALSLSVVMLAFAVYELLVWLRDRSSGANLSLAVLFGLMGCYDIFVSRVYSAPSAAASVPWLRLLSATDDLVAFVFLWFLRLYGGKVGGRALAIFGATFGAIALLELAAPGDIAWIASRSITIPVELPLFGPVVFRQVSSGPLSIAALASGIAIIVYCFRAIGGIARAGKANEAWGLRVACLVSFLAILNDTAIGGGVYRFVFLTEYAWAFNLFYITYLLSSEMVENAMAKRKLETSLSELRDADLALKQSQALWAALLENVPLTIWMCDKEGRLIMQNAADIAAVGDHVGSFYEEWAGDSEVARLFGTINRRALEGEVVREELSFEVEGKKRFYLDVISPAFSEGKLIGSIGIGINVTEQKVAESQVQVLSRAIEQSPAIVMITDTKGDIGYVNPSFEAITGYSSAEALGMNPRILKSGHTSDAEYRELWRTISSGREWQGEFHNRRKDGSLYWEAASISPVVDSQGQVAHYVAVKQDITARKAQEDRLMASLAEKEVLLREVHHRVKNNLQVVSSLLRINGDGISEPHAQEVFAESQRQIRTISLVHEALYMSENLAKIDFPAYLDGIAREIVGYYGRGDIRVRIEAEPIPMDIDRAIPCGLLVNELLTNAFKHAFPGGRGGGVRVALARLPSGLVGLAVEDDGIGINEGFDAQASPTMGMKLVASLAAQLGGRLRIEGRGPDAAFAVGLAGETWRSRFSVEFPLPRGAAGDEPEVSGIGSR